MNTDTRCPGCGRANTVDPAGLCHACGYGRPDPAAAALREQIREVTRLRDEVLGPAAERFRKSGIPEVIRAAVADVVVPGPAPEALEAAVAAGVRDGLAEAPPAAVSAGAMEQALRSVLDRWPPPPPAQADRQQAARGAQGLERMRAAYHEAGHTIAAHRYGCQVTEVTIDRDRAPQLAKRADAIGCACYGPLPATVWGAGYAAAVVRLAGFAAEAVRVGELDPTVDPFASDAWLDHPDLHKADRLVRQARRPLHVAMAVAMRVVVAHWPELAALGELLLAQETLGAGEVAALLGPARAREPA